MDPEVRSFKGRLWLKAFSPETNRPGIDQEPARGSEETSCQCGPVNNWEVVCCPFQVESGCGLRLLRFLPAVQKHPVRHSDNQLQHHWRTNRRGCVCLFVCFCRVGWMSGWMDGCIFPLIVVVNGTKVSVMGLCPLAPSSLFSDPVVLHHLSSVSVCLRLHHEPEDAAATRGVPGRNDGGCPVPPPGSRPACSCWLQLFTVHQCICSRGRSTMTAVISRCGWLVSSTAAAFHPSLLLCPPRLR